MNRIFLLSPAHCGGERAQLILRREAAFDLARRLRTAMGAPLGEIFSFLSGLYFRGKLAYARAFARPPSGVPGAWIITPSAGLWTPEEPITLAELREFAKVPISVREARYRVPLAHDARKLAMRVGPGCELVLLGSVASGKYVDVLGAAVGDRLRFPVAFAGRGDMSRGSLMLRCVDADLELEYVGLNGAARHGSRPAKLPPRR